MWNLFVRISVHMSTSGFACDGINMYDFGGTCVLVLMKSIFIQHD